MAGTPLSIFISYSRTDSAFVDRLEADLNARNFYTWVDRLKLEGGQNFRSEIQKAIDHCQIMLVVLSPEAMASKYVRQEYEYADSRDKHIIPLNWRTTIEVFFGLHGIHWVDFRGSHDQGLADLLNALSRLEFAEVSTTKPHMVSTSTMSVRQPEALAKGVGRHTEADWTNLDERYPSKKGTSSKSLLEFYNGKLRAYGNKNSNLAHRSVTSAQDAKAYEEAAKLLYRYAEIFNSVLEQPTKKMTEAVLTVWDEAEKHEHHAKEQNNKIIQDAVMVILSEFRQTWNWARMGANPGNMMNA